MVEYTQNTSWNKLSQSWVPINKTSNTTLQMTHHMPHRCNFTLYFWRAPGEGYNNHWRTCAHRVQPACHSPLPCDPYSALIHWFIRWSPVLTPTFIFLRILGYQTKACGSTGDAICHSRHLTGIKRRHGTGRVEMKNTFFMFTHAFTMHSIAIF